MTASPIEARFKYLESREVALSIEVAYLKEETKKLREDVAGLRKVVARQHGHRLDGEAGYRW
jgi:hypothetical protein